MSAAIIAALKNQVHSLAKQDSNSIGKTDTTPVSVCICNRPVQDILCQACGFIFVGHVRKPCPEHRNNLFYLMDTQFCPQCKSTYLLEIKTSDKQLHDVVDPTRQRHKSDAHLLKNPVSVNATRRASTGSRMRPTPEEDWSDSINFKAEYEATSKPPTTNFGDEKNLSHMINQFNRSQINNSANAFGTPCHITPAASNMQGDTAVSRMVQYNSKGTSCDSKPFMGDLKITVPSSSNTNSQSQTIDQQNKQGQISASRPVLVDSGVQTEFNVQVNQEPQYQPPLSQPKKLRMLTTLGNISSSLSQVPSVQPNTVSEQNSVTASRPYSANYSKEQTAPLEHISVAPPPTVLGPYLPPRPPINPMFVRPSFVSVPMQHLSLQRGPFMSPSSPNILRPSVLGMSLQQQSQPDINMKFMQQGQRQPGINMVSSIQQGQRQPGIGTLSSIQQGQRQPGVNMVSSIQQGQRQPGIDTVSSIQQGQMQPGVSTVSSIQQAQRQSGIDTVSSMQQGQRQPGVNTVSSIQQGHNIYGYNPRKPVGISKEYSLLQQALNRRQAGSEPLHTFEEGRM
ncbi:mediator of RNA polymerase II transcription subunit 12-like [Dreissena polymorpha]|uniref:Uncharacterized protein n=1 Tax=Dreissena polymorpha TaxID=45954 RepID=A0A9D4KP95_DREPO|nr:mediator of RNA polymerase II transcription subunit 12-like [Dreissena polymorpha]KAH3843250.1 hypothetical protein DPMN_116762 [Dreissena polymorpha]